MKIVSWNCHGRFREKFHIVQQLDADICVIQECENPAKYQAQFAGFPYEHIWQGDKDAKGLAIFLKRGVHFRINDWPVYCLRHFISLHIDDAFDLVGVWAGPPYIEEYYIYQYINIGKYNDHTVIVGDFNSNAIWDKKHQFRNHGAVVAQLRDIGLHSAYHFTTGERHGSESQPTFYLYNHNDRPYHIDYCFLNPARLGGFEVLSGDVWRGASDHLPLLINLLPGQA